MNYVIRDSQASDMPEVLNLIQELATFEKEENAVDITAEDLVRDGFGGKKLFHCFVCELDDAVVGAALIYPRYSTWKGPIIHLEDLIVSEKVRGKGIGTALLDAVVQHGKKLGVKRINWEVIDWNEPAIKFYEKKGARVLRDWDVVQLDQKGIDNYIKQI